VILVDPPCELLFQSVHGVLVLRENVPPCVLTHAVSTVLYGAAPRDCIGSGPNAAGGTRRFDAAS
jgi:hypothetical protein